jgi:hypothetical protein
MTTITTTAVRSHISQSISGLLAQFAPEVAAFDAKLHAAVEAHLAFLSSTVPEGLISKTQQTPTRKMTTTMMMMTMTMTMILQ